MDGRIVKKIKCFISDLENKVPGILLDWRFVDYDDGTSAYLIRHNIENEDSNFSRIVVTLLRQYFYSEGIYNIGFSYDYECELAATEEISINEFRFDFAPFKNADSFKDARSLITYEFVNQKVEILKKTLGYNSSFEVDLTESNMQFALSGV